MSLLRCFTRHPLATDAAACFVLMSLIVGGCGPVEPRPVMEAPPPTPFPTVIVEAMPLEPLAEVPPEPPQEEDVAIPPGALYEPKLAEVVAPERFEAVFRTTKGELTVTCERSNAPHGVDRFYALVKIGFFDDVAIYRVAPGFVAQWGLHGDPAVNRAWAKAHIPADPVAKSNVRGTLAMAMAMAPTSRITQVFINYADNTHLDKMGFAPICEVTAGMAVADAFYSGYRDQPTIAQREISEGGNALLKSKWPLLDYVISAEVVPSSSP